MCNPHVITLLFLRTVARLFAELAKDAKTKVSRHIVSLVGDIRSVESLTATKTEALRLIRDCLKSSHFQTDDINQSHSHFKFCFGDSPSCQKIFFVNYQSNTRKLCYDCRAQAIAHQKRGKRAMEKLLHAR